MQGEVTLTALIAPSGAVTGVGGGGGSLGPIVGCLKKVVEKGKFAPPEGESGSLVLIPITLRQE